MKRIQRTTFNARNLRKKSTEAEKILWNELRNRKFMNLKFRRQHPLERYTVDFFCHQKQLIVELDGSIHDDINQKEYDIRRQTELEAMGYHIVRFKNEDVLKEVKEVLSIIEKLLETY